MASGMKILFLDVDGVLNTYSSGGLYTLKKSCLKRLQRIVEETGCKIVLSSTWRKDEYALRRLKRVLKYRNISIMSCTPVLHNSIRGLEIAMWLNSNNVSTYAIVDDDSDMEDWQLPHFFQTDPKYGLTDTITHRIIQHLTM